MKALRTLTACALLAAAAVATTVAEERIETITVTAKPLRSSVLVEKVPPAPVERVAVPMPTDMPEADIDYHMPLIGAAAIASREQTES